MTFDAAAAAWFLLEVSLRAVAAAAAVAVLLRLLRMRAAAVLHSAWTAVLFAMLLMPVLQSIVPPLPVPLPARAGGLLGGATGTRQPPSGVVEYSRRAPNDTRGTPSTRRGDPVRLASPLPTAVSNARAPRSWIPLMLVGDTPPGLSC